MPEENTTGALVSPRSDTANDTPADPLPIAVGEYLAKDNTHWNPDAVNWEKFCGHPVTRTRDKFAVPSYVFGKIVPTERAGCAGRDNCNGYHRTKVSVVERYAITLDADFLDRDGDGDSKKLLKLLADLGLAALVYDTYSSRPGAMRLRIVVPINCGVGPMEYRAIARQLMRELGWDGKVTKDEDGTKRFGPFDRGSQQASRLMYLQSAPKGRKTYRQTFDGDPLDAQDWIWAAEASEPEVLQEPPERPAVDIAAPATPGQVAAATEALWAAAEALRGMEPDTGRNNFLYEKSIDLFEYVDGGCIDHGLVVETMKDAAIESGLTPEETLGTLGSAETKAIVNGPNRPPMSVDEVFGIVDEGPVIEGKVVDSVPDLRPVATYDDRAREDVRALLKPPFGLPDWLANAVKEFVRDGGGKPVTELGRALLLANVDKAMRRLEVGYVAPPPGIGLDDLLAEPDESQDYRIHGVWPSGGRVLLEAMKKVGKTTLRDNVIRSLVDGDELLGQFKPVPAGRVVLLDVEMDRRQIRRWLRDQQIENAKAVTVFPLRGRVSSFNILDPVVLREWAELIGTADVVILDCLRPVLDAIGLDEHKQAGRFLTAFDALLEAVGKDDAADGFLVHHMGHSNERGRGDSRIEDWPDAIWKAIKENPDELDSRRFFSAFGRDVNIPEAGVDFDQETRRWTLDTESGSRKSSSKIDMRRRVFAYIVSEPGAKTGQIDAAIGGDNTARRAALQSLISDGFVRVEPGKQRAKHHFAKVENLEAPEAAATLVFDPVEGSP